MMSPDAVPSIRANRRRRWSVSGLACRSLFIGDASSVFVLGLAKHLQ
jgi:hypothetical protein